MKYGTARLARWLAVLIVLPGLLFGTGVSSASGWSIVSSPNPGTASDALLATTVAFGSQMLAVGYSINTGGVEQTLVLRSGGKTWSVMPSPNAGLNVNNMLDAVGSVPGTTTKAWAGGSFVGPTGVQQTLFELLMGNNWAVVPSPNVGTGDNVIRGVVALDNSDAWAVGYYVDSTGVRRTLIEHWDGLNWGVIPSPNPSSTSNSLFAVTAPATNNVWAVGQYHTAAGTRRTLIEHWTGSNWLIVKSANAGTGDNVLFSVASLPASKSVWAAGFSVGAGNVAKTLTERWNGSAWSVVSSPNVGTASNELYSITLVPSSSAAWAVGWYATATGVRRTLTERWGGSAWSVVTSPNGSTHDNLMTGVAPMSTPTPIWTVGLCSTGSAPSPTTLTERFG